MTDVCVKPMPEWQRKTPRRLWTGHPPIFQDIPETGITEDDRRQARELFVLLDDESQDWFLGSCKWLAEKPLKSKKIKKHKEGKPI